jgi:hypothetical protein
MEVRTGTLSFLRARDIGPRTEPMTFNFSNPVRQAVAGLAGTNFGFSPRDDHHLGLVNVRLSTSINNDVVTVEGTFGVRDWSGEYDDDYEGSIQFVLLAELETGSVASNLTITSVEYNQTIQFFRSQLDPATAQRDNSIGLIAGKSTVLRTFVDTQTDPTRPTIASISGLLEIRLPNSATWIPISPLNGPIQAKRDSAISRRNANDTLNFLIPGSFCVGNVDIRVRVFDATHPNQPGFTSGQFQDTLEFTAVESLNIRGVGVHYTGKGLNIPAPPVTALTTTLSFVRKNYPVGVVFIAGYTVIDYAGDFKDQSGDGCGSGWDGLLDKLRDMQGDSNEIYYGLVPAGVPLGWGGCGGGDGQVAAGPFNAGATAAQEIAHAFGRDHAPSGSCGQNPGNVDGNYPPYDALPSGSIGEFGIDDLGVVKDPASIFDFMSYCQPMWVSPYTYEGLRQHFRPVPASPIGLIQTHRDFTEPPSGPSQYLFLNFRVYRGGKVEVFPSFHYSSLPTVKPGRRTPYAIELRDSHNKVLNAQRVLLTDPHEDLDSASLDFFKPIPFHEDTARVVITCSIGEGCEQKELLTADVPSEPPKVRIVSPENGGRLAGKVRVAWEAQFDEKPLHYLLRYSNDSGQSWRAVAPRLRVTEYIVDLDHLPGGERCQFQVLATEGIRTGMAVSETFSVPHKLRETTIIEPPSGTVVAPGQIVTFLGESFSPDVGSANPSEMRWYADAEHLLGIGQEIQTSTLSPGVHTISLRASDGFGGESTASIQIEVKAPIPTTHTSLTQPNHTSRDHQVS